MDGDGSCFSLPSTSDFPKGQDASDVSWADMFLDGIHSDDPGTSEAGSISSDTSGLGANIHGGAQQLVHQTQPNVMGGQLQIHIPTNLQGSLTSNAVQQGGTNLCGTVAYLAPSVSTQQQVGNVGRIQNMVAVTGQPHFTTSVGQPQHQGSAKLVQIAPSFPMTSVQPLASSVPIQTLIQPNQTLTGQTIYGSQGTGLFPAQGSVHIENPKVVNVNFGPHVIGSDGSGQQAIIQTAEGKRVLITNSQVQHMSQPISLTQPLVGTQLISSAGGNVIRASMPSGTHTIVPANATGTRQIVLPTGQTMIPRQAGTTQSGIAKNVVISNLNQNMSPVIYQSGQTGQLIHSQPTLIASSGSGLQVVNAGGSQGGQVQLITQPSLNQASVGQQQLNQSTIMNLINNSSVIPGTGNQITGLVPGQNIFVNGQMLNIGQLGGLTVPQLQVQHNTQGGMTLANLNATVTHAAQFQPTAQQLVIQQNGQQHQILLQPKNSPSPSLTANVPSQRLSSGLPGTKSIPTPTSSANSASSTPVPTPTPTPTPDLTSDSCDSGGKTCQGINILEQALALSAIDLQSFEDDFKFLENTDFPAIKTPPPPPPQPKIQPTKSKSKPSKAKPKTIQPNINMTVNNSSVSFQPSAQLQNAQGQKVTVSPQQKIITASGQVFVLSANGQQFILQPSTTTASPVVPQLQPINSVASVAGSINRTSISIPSSSQLQELNQQVVDQSSYGSKISDDHKHSPLSVTVPTQQKATFAMVSTRANKIVLKTSPESAGTFKLETASQSMPSSELVFTTMPNVNSPQDTISQTSSSFSQAQTLHLKNQKITTLSGTFFKQEPLEAVVKQEPSTELHPAVSTVQTTPNVLASTMNLPHATLTATTSNVIAMNAPLISSASFTSASTTTTQSHQVTIMSTAQVTGTWQTSAPVAGTYPTYSLTSNDKQISVGQPQSTTTLIHSGSSIPSVITCTSTAASKSNSKEKDPANIKSMIPIKIADSTLMLSLTPVQKERLENEISRMSREDQKGLLLHQQNIFRRTQKVQQKQMEQQMKQQHEKQQLLLQQQLQQQHVQQSPEFEQLQRDVIGQSQQQQLTHSPALKLSLPAQVTSRPELMSPQAGHTMLGLPTTVQELEKSDERDIQLNFQSFAPKSQDQTKQMSQTSQLQQSQLPTIQQQQIHSSLPSRTVALSHSMGSVQQFVIPQTGRCLAEQQLLRDRSLALSPDVNTPFKSLSDAMRRLVRYHTLQDHKPEDGSKTMRIWDTRYSKLCDYLMKKKRYYMRRFNKMKLYHDMCQHKQPEYIQNLKCFNEQLQELLESEKEKAKNHPDLFEPVRPGFLSYDNDHLANSGDVSNEKKMIVDNMEETHRHSLKMEDITVKETTTDPDTSSEQSVSSTASVSAKIRKIPDKGSTGTLKLVFTRRTTDNFIVKKSLTDMSEIPQDFKPMVNLKKSDSEYEFDPQTSVNCNQPVIVRRRTVSIASRQTSSDESSDSSSSVSSQVGKVQDHSSVEEDMEEEVDQNNDEREDEDMQDEEEDDTNDEDDKSSGDEEEEQFVEGGRCSRNGYEVSFEDQVGENDNNDSCGVNADAFMEAEEITGNEDVHQYKTVAPDVPAQSFLTYDENHGSSTEKHQGERKSSQCLPHTGSLTSHVFNSSLTYSSTDPALVKRSNEYDDISQVVKRVHQPVFSFEANAGQVTSSYGQNPRTASSAQVEEFISGSPVSSMEREAASKGLPGSALFTTPNKNLLETDDMFNSDDEVDLRGSRRMVSTFEIDNKDPQSSMISDSVRSAINSVLGGDDDDDDDDDDDCNEGSQTSWAASTRIPSSSVHHSLYQSSSATSSVSHSHDVDLDVAVQTILNNQ